MTAMQLDLARWAVVAHKDDTGFGRLAEDMRAVLGLGQHLVIPSERLSDKPLSDSGEIRLAPDSSEEFVRSALAPLQGIIFFERHNWHPLLLPAARSLGVKTVCVPMWEWFNGRDKEWQLCDLFICPSNWSLQVVRKFNWQSSIRLPACLDMERFPNRAISGPARLFVHNAGLVDPDDRKSTRETIEAFKRVKRDDIRLVVRLQKPADLPALDNRISVVTENLKNPAALYAEGEVAVQPSKLEGVGFMVLEPVLSGMPVITLDYPPMNEFVRDRQLLVRKRWLKRRSYGSVWFKHAHLRLPDIGDLARKIEWCAENDLASISKENRQWSESIFNRASLRSRYESVLQALVEDRLADHIKDRGDQ